MTSKEPKETYRLYKLSHGYRNTQADARELAIVWAHDEAEARELAHEVFPDSNAFGPRGRIDVEVIFLTPGRPQIVYTDFDYT